MIVDLGFAMRYDGAMTKYCDAQGRRWDSAEEALADFTSDLPPLTDEEQENVFSATRHDADAATNLEAIRFAVTYHGLADKFGYYPIPEVDVEAERGFTWDQINNKFMVSLDVDWDIANVPFFQYQRQEYNRRVLASLGPPYEPYRQASGLPKEDFYSGYRPLPHKKVDCA